MGKRYILGREEGSRGERDIHMRDVRRKQGGEGYIPGKEKKEAGEKRRYILEREGGNRGDKEIYLRVKRNEEGVRRIFSWDREE